MNKPNLKIVLATIFILGLTLGGIFGYRAAVGAYVGDVTDIYVNPPFSEASYVVGQYNSTFYYAKNGTTGNYDLLGTNARILINNVFGSITAAPPQKIVVLKGNFTLDGALVVGSYTYVDATQAVLIMGVGVSSDTVQFASGATMSEWHGGLIVGNGG